jgi:hypothetical protein
MLSFKAMVGFLSSLPKEGSKMGQLPMEEDEVTTYQLIKKNHPLALAISKLANAQCYPTYEAAMTQFAKFEGELAKFIDSRIERARKSDKELLAMKDQIIQAQQDLIEVLKKK